jgi:hypothetical protein
MKRADKTPLNRFLGHRDEFPGLMAQLGVRTAVEVGSAEGWFAGKLLACPTLERLWLVDPWVDLNHRRACEEIARRDERVRLVYTSSLEAARVVPDVDFAYIDAGHDYSSVRQDLHLWWPKTQRLIAGHDYTLSPLPYRYLNGVILAVEEFFRDEAPDAAVHVTGAAAPDYVERLRSAYAAHCLEDLGPWNSHNPSFYVFKES